MRKPRLHALSLPLALAMAACAAPHAYRAQAASPLDDAPLLDAAEQALARDRPGDARESLAQLTGSPLDPRQKLRLTLIEAEIALAEDRPVVALQRVPPPGEIRDAALAARAEADRARALFRMGDAIAATQALVRREALLPDPAQQADNREQLWNGLRTTELDTASGPRLAQADKTTRGWIELALISRSVWLDPRDLQARLAQWSTDYPDHPGRERIEAFAQTAAPPSHKEVQVIALLLPLTGPFGAGAEAVRDGFFSAYFDPRADLAQPVVHVYDTGATADAMRAAYRHALDDGAQFVVGPLTREDVAALAADGRPDVPVLALNYLDPGQAPPFNFFQAGLAPEDEARQAAERAIADRQYRAVTLAPEGDWGDRIVKAFGERLEQLGGVVVGSRAYPADEHDYSDAIQALLGLDASAERHRALTAAIGVKSEFEPRRRDDVDLVFVVARPDQARLLGPQLRFYRTGDLPIYATSAIYEGGTPPADLNGLRFCDMPWMLDTDGRWAALRAQLHSLFPARTRDYARLLALGHDAYTLVRLIDAGTLAPGSFFPAATGTLSLRDDRVIGRGLSCVEIRNGALKALDVSLTP